MLAAWGKNDPFFLPAGAEAFRRDVPDAIIRFFDTGHFALESALDELAYETGVDPVALRLLNDTDIDPESGRPFSTRAMRKCLTQGAVRFGWDRYLGERGGFIGMTGFGASGPADELYKHFGIVPSAVVAEAKRCLQLEN